jgi:hypothetical protein
MNILNQLYHEKHHFWLFYDGPKIRNLVIRWWDIKIESQKSFHFLSIFGNENENRYQIKNWGQPTHWWDLDWGHCAPPRRSVYKVLGMIALQLIFYCFGYGRHKHGSQFEPLLWPTWRAVKLSLVLCSWFRPTLIQQTVMRHKSPWNSLSEPWWAVADVSHVMTVGQQNNFTWWCHPPAELNGWGCQLGLVVACIYKFYNQHFTLGVLWCLILSACVQSHGVSSSWVHWVCFLQVQDWCTARSCLKLKSQGIDQRQREHVETNWRAFIAAGTRIFGNSTISYVADIPEI